MKTASILLGAALIIQFSTCTLSAQSLTYKIVDTGQNTFYNNTNTISAPAKDNPFYGQDAQYKGYQQSYTDNGDGTISDNVTGLMWQKSPDLNGDGIINYNDKLTYEEAVAAADTFSLAGYADWRLPTIKEQYSLILFTGIECSGWNGSDVSVLKPFIDNGYFDFGYGDTDAGERIIDAQFATSTIYKGTTMNGNATMFGVNFADGRIKGYPCEATPMGTKKFYILFVRGNNDYGKNKFVDNGDGTITDNASGLMWSQDDSKKGLNWEEALDWVQQKNSENYLGHNDWRLPNIKELQSIVDYSRSPQSTNSAAINPLFSCSTITDEGGNEDYPFYWSGTTHANMMKGDYAAYVAFGEALGWMEDPFNGSRQLMDVHGAGAQRSDPKVGNPSDYPYGHGPQGDVIRIYNYVRMVRDNNSATSSGESNIKVVPDNYGINQNYPNPFNPETTIIYQIPAGANVRLKVYNALGKEVTTLLNDYRQPGKYSVAFNPNNLSLPSGVYYYRINVGNFSKTMKMIYIK